MSNDSSVKKYWANTGEHLAQWLLLAEVELWVVIIICKLGKKVN